jgi:hypothetical protein
LELAEREGGGREREREERERERTRGEREGSQPEGGRGGGGERVIGVEKATRAAVSVDCSDCVTCYDTICHGPVTNIGSFSFHL